MNNTKCRREAHSAEIKLAELRQRLLEIKDLIAASALLFWDQATYMPKCGATAHAPQGASISRLTHEKSVAPSSASCSRNLSHMSPVYPTSPTKRASYALRGEQRKIEIKKS